MDAVDGTEDRFAPREVARIRRAARLAPRALPGPVGEVLAHELQVYADSGRAFGPDGLLDRVIDDLLGTRVPVLVPTQRAAS